MKRGLVIVALLAIGGLAAGVAPFASDAPDGLQTVAAEEGFAASEREHALDDGPLAGYSVEGVEDEDLATGLSGLTGVVFAFATATGAFGLLARIRRRRDDGAGS